MGTEIYLNAVKEAKQELELLKKQHMGILRKIEVLENFIDSGLSLTREIPGAGQELPPTPPEEPVSETTEAAAFKSAWPPEL